MALFWLFLDSDVPTIKGDPCRSHPKNAITYEHRMVPTAHEMAVMNRYQSDRTVPPFYWIVFPTSIKHTKRYGYLRGTALTLIFYKPPISVNTVTRGYISFVPLVVHTVFTELRPHPSPPMADYFFPDLRIFAANFQAVLRIRIRALEHFDPWIQDPW